MTIPNRPTVLAALLFGVLCTLPFLPFAREKSKVATLRLELRQTTSVAGNAQLFYDLGRGYNQRDSITVPIAGTGRPEQLVFEFPNENCRALRYDPIDRNASLSIDAPEFRYDDGTLARTLAASDFQPANGIAALTPSGAGFSLRLEKETQDPFLLLTAKPPAPRLINWRSLRANLVAMWPALLIAAFISTSASALNAPAGRRRLAELWTWSLVRPHAALALAGLLAVCASNYPIIFLGRSFVSPNYGTLLLYDKNPTLPGIKDTRTEDPKGSDVGALMWAVIAYTTTQHESLIEHGELPLWNRYNSNGVTLLGQGQSMFGDPLHFLPLLTNGAAWAWDLKYILAKWLFALGLGVSVWIAMRHLPAALLVAFSAPFLSFFVFRVDHAAIFSLCYSPWVLVCWLKLNEAITRRQLILGALALMGANWWLMNSGTVKEAYMLLLGLNLTGMLILLGNERAWSERWRILAAAMAAGVLFILIASPIWVTFLSALKKAHTNYDLAEAWQLSPGLMLGFFDELFFRPFSPELNTFKPGMNLFFLGGLVFFLATLRSGLHSRAVLAIAISALLPLSLIFGLIPSAWITAVPFLGNVIHIDNSFSCVLFVQVALLAGAGYKAAAQRLGTSHARGDLLVASLLIFGLVLGYAGFAHSIHRNAFGPGMIKMPATPEWGAPISSFVWNSLWLSLAALAASALIVRRLQLRREFTAATGVLLFTAIVVLHWRTGQHLPTGFDDFVVNPAARTDLSATSPAVVLVQRLDKAEPARVLGLGNNLFPGWSGVYHLESPVGPDPIVNRYYFDLMRAAGLAGGSDWAYTYTAENIRQHLPVLDMLNVRHYLASESLPASTTLRLEQSDDLQIYESKSAWPRAFFTNRVIGYDTPEGLVAILRQENRGPFAAVENSMLNRLGRAGRPEGNSVEAATRYIFTPNSSAFSIRASGPGVVVLSEAFLESDFQATLNGQPVPYFRVNHLFKGIRVDRAGEYEVSFRYRPEHLTLCLWLATIGLLGAIMAACYALRAASASAKIA